jgi:YaiO family outer membrane protein
MRNRVFLCFFICTLIFNVSLIFADEGNHLNLLTVNFQNSSLSNGYENHKNRSLKLYLDKYNTSINMSEVQRYGFKDSSFQSTHFMKINSNLKSSVSYSKSNEGIFIPKNLYMIDILYDFNNSYLISTSKQKSNYKSGINSDVTKIGFIRYYRDFRFAIDHYISKIEKSGESSSNRITAHYYFNKHYIALAKSSGSELEILSNGITLPVNVNNISLYGQFFISNRWRLGYSFSKDKVSNIYRKDNLGIELIFNF